MPLDPLATVQSRISAIESRIAALSNGGRPPVALTESGALQSGGAKNSSSTVPNPLFAGTLGNELAKADAKLSAQFGGAGKVGATAAASAPSENEPLAQPGTKAQAFVAELKKHLGVPYVWGGTNPATGLDCSGLVQTAARAVGVSVPRVTWDQWKAGQKVESLAQAAPGDLLITRGGAHVAVYLGGGKAIHAPRPGKVVTYVDVEDLGKIAGIRRVMPSDEAADTSAPVPSPSDLAASSFGAATLGASNADAVTRALSAAKAQGALSEAALSALGTTPGASAQTYNPLLAAAHAGRQAAGLGV